MLEDSCSLSDNTSMKSVKLLTNTCLFLISSCLSLPVFAVQSSIQAPANPAAPDPLGQQLYDNYHWSAMYYYGQTVNGALVGTAVGNFKHWPEHIQSLELAYTLNSNNPVRQFFSPLVGVVQIAGNFTQRQGWNQHTIYEFDPYIIFRWANWPWNHYLDTSFAFAEGISYDSSVASIEKRDNENTRRLMNYLMFEVTFAAPSHPQLQFLIRIHHRSGAYGLYHAGNNGSNDLGGGIRYLF